MSERIPEEKLFEQLALNYAEKYGRSLLDERDALAQQGQASTPGLDQKVARKLKGRSRVLRAGAMAAAACLLLALFLPRLQSIWGRSPSAPAPDASQTQPPPMGTQPPAQAPALPAPAPAYEVLPLGFTPEDGFQVTDFEQDNGKTIYYIADSRMDDVVITLEKSEYLAIIPTEGLRPLTIHGHEAFGMYRPEYSLLLFEREGVLYTMTCRYEFDTLIACSEPMFL